MGGQRDHHYRDVLFCLLRGMDLLLYVYGCMFTPHEERLILIACHHSSRLLFMIT
jgi:hypothetical protein